VNSCRCSQTLHVRSHGAESCLETRQGMESQQTCCTYLPGSDHGTSPCVTPHPPNTRLPVWLARSTILWGLRILKNAPREMAAQYDYVHWSQMQYSIHHSLPDTQSSTSLSLSSSSLDSLLHAAAISLKPLAGTMK